MTNNRLEKENKIMKKSKWNIKSVQYFGGRKNYIIELKSNKNDVSRITETAWNEWPE